MTARRPGDPEFDLNDLRQWQFEREGLEQYLREIETRAKTLLNDSNASQTQLDGATMVIFALGTLRSNLPAGELAPIRAARAAVVLGVFSDDSIGKDVARAALQRQRKTTATKGGKKTGKKISQTAAKKNPAIKNAVNVWNDDPDLREEWPDGFTAYAHQRTGQGIRTIQRRLKAMKLTPLKVKKVTPRQ